MLAVADRWSMGSWMMLAVFLGLLGVGIALAVIASGARTRGRAHALLDERFARGDISEDEYRERGAALGPPPRGFLNPLAISLSVIGLIGAIVVGVTASSGLMDRMMSEMGAMMGTGTTERSGAAPVEGARAIRVTGSEFSFTPQEIRVRQGETVNLVFENRGGMFHTLTAGELGVDLRANGGDRIAGALQATRRGTYSFICAVAGHADAGMRGRIEVE
jgi:uncharacterized cupredoxin-like copper-binding protein